MRHLPGGTIAIFAFVFVAACGDSQNPDPASPEGSGGTGDPAIDGSGGIAIIGETAGMGGALATGGAGGAPGGTSGASGKGGAAQGGAPNNTGGGAGAGGSVSAPPAQGTPGVWENVTPAGLGLSFDGPNGGVVHHVLVDAARPSDIYALTSGGQGVWKSTDFGGAWTRVDTKTPLTGSQRASAIDSNRLRDPSTPPTLWTVNAGGGDHLWKSTDGGVSWRQIKLPAAAAYAPYDRDPYSFAVDPYDGKHLLMGYHGVSELSESTDGGETWTVLTTPALGTSVYPFFIDTGTASSTRGNWITQSQWDSNKAGIWRTTDGGTSWKQVSLLEHAHGNGQIFDAGAGVVYAAGLDPDHGGNGVFRSSDSGMTWTQVNDGRNENAVYGTAKYLYTDFGWATAGSAGPNLQRALRSTGTGWSDYVAAPKGMTNGSNHACVTSDGKHAIIVTGNWTAGIWRYIEP